MFLDFYTFTLHGSETFVLSKKTTHAHAQRTWIIIHKDFNCEKFFTLLYRVQQFCSNATQSKLYSKLYPKQTKNKSVNAGNSSFLSVFVSTNSASILTMDMFWTRLLVKATSYIFLLKTKYANHMTGLNMFSNFPNIININKSWRRSSLL